MDQLKTLGPYDLVGDVRGRGFLIGIEFVKNKETREPFGGDKSGKIAGMISKQCLKNGLLIYPGSGAVDGHRGDHILVAPPFVIQKSGIDDIVSILGQSIAEVEAEVL